MKRAIIFFLSLTVLGIVTSFKQVPSPAFNSEGIEFFEGNWNQLLDKAKKENKHIFLDAYASWCGPCKMMKKRVFTDKEVGAFFNKNFISVAIDMEKGEGPALSNKYSVQAYPTLIFLNSKGAYVGKSVGYHSAKDLLKLAEEVLKKK
ncbi:MAG: thioredoxin family protein [Bacteroidetes bacterium]|nr:thioredoxin family protein [Bacteroidota bacterium]